MNTEKFLFDHKCNKRSHIRQTKKVYFKLALRKTLQGFVLIRITQLKYLIVW